MNFATTEQNYEERGNNLSNGMTTKATTCQAMESLFSQEQMSIESSN